MGIYLQSLVAMVDPYLMQILVNVGIAIVLALGLNVIVGLTGQLSLGHAAFMSIGAFASAMITIKTGIPFSLNLVLTGVVTAIVAEDSIDAATRAMFSHSTTLGVRVRPVTRRALPRDEVVVSVDTYKVRVKRGLLDGQPVTMQAEYDDAAEAAERLGLPVRVVLDRAAALARVTQR